MDEHIVKPSGSIVKTLEWLTSHGVARGWYLHGRNGSAVIFQEDYHSTPRVAMQGDKLLFQQETETDKGYIVVTQPESEDAEAGGVVRPSNMIDNGGSADVSPDAIDHASNDPAAVPDVSGVVIGTAATAGDGWGGARLYIAGPMTGIKDFNYPAFRHATVMLDRNDYDIEDPSTNSLPEGSKWEAYMRVTIPQMLSCDGVALLEGWENSRGARLEVFIAAALGIRCMPVEEWLAL